MTIAREFIEVNQLANLGCMFSRELWMGEDGLLDIVMMLMKSVWSNQ